MRIYISVLFVAMGVFSGHAEAQLPSSRNGALGAGFSAVSPELPLDVRVSVRKGTEWLLNAINRRGVGVDIDQPPDLSCTAITGLALLSQGNTVRGGRHSSELRGILGNVLHRVDEIREESKPREAFTLVQRKIGRNADIFLSAIFLSQILGDAGFYEKDVRQSLEKLARIISSSQGPDGTWGNESWAPVLGTVLGWESLRASHSCGIEVGGSAKRAGDALMLRLKTQTLRESDWMQNFYKEASSVRVLHSLGHQRDLKFRECVDRILKFATEDDRPFIYAGGEEYLAFSMVTECLIREADPSWKTWYPVVSKKLVRVQNSDGSWSGHHCITSRTFCTAAALLTLQAPNRYLPLSEL